MVSSPRKLVARDRSKSLGTQKSVPNCLKYASLSQSSEKLYISQNSNLMALSIAFKPFGKQNGLQESFPNELTDLSLSSKRIRHLTKGHCSRNIYG